MINKEPPPDYWRIAAPPTEGYTLDRCPFCGDNSASLEKPGDYHVHCWTCGAQTTDAPNANYAIWCWNRRIVNRTRPAALDMPDGPGWWGHVHPGKTFVVYFGMWLIKGKNVILTWNDGGAITYEVTKFKKDCPGGWYRLHVPWETG